MIQIVDSDSGFFVIENGRAWHGGMDSLSLSDTLVAVRGAIADAEFAFGGAIVPKRADDVLRLRGARIVAS